VRVTFSPKGVIYIKYVYTIYIETRSDLPADHPSIKGCCNLTPTSPTITINVEMNEQQEPVVVVVVVVVGWGSPARKLQLL